MSRPLRIVFALSSVVAFSAAMACGSSKDDSSTTGSVGGVVLVDGVKILDAKKANDVTVLPGQLQMPTSTHDAPKVGDIMVGEPGEAADSANKWGFLRRVTEVREEGGKYILTTVNAELGDVVKEGEFQTTLEVPSLAPDDPSAVGEPTSAFKGDKTIKLLDFSGKELFSNTGSVDISTGKSIGYEAKVVLSKGTLDFTPKFDVGAKLGFSGFSLKGLVKEAHVVATGQLNAVAEVDASFKLTSTATGDDVAALIAKKVFGKPSTTIADHKIKLPSFKFGPLSVPAHVEFKAVVACDLKWGGETRVVVGGKASASVSVGARYDGKDITPVFDHTESLEKTGPTWTITNDMGLRCSIKPEMRLNLWDVASGEILAEAYAAVNAKARCDASKLTGTVTGNAYAGVNAKAHAKLDVFGLYKWEKECTLFDLQTPVADVSGSFPLGSGATCTAAPDEPLPTPVKSPDASCFGKTSTGGEDAGTDSGPVLCDHDVCTNGTPLTTGCTQDAQGGACIKAICENDPYCCTTAWSASCIDKVEKGMYGCTARKCTTP